MSYKPAAVRFYIDEDILGLAQTLAALRNDVTFPGDAGATIHKRSRPACPIASGTKDEEWLPRVTRLGWLVISRDIQISDNIAELRAVRESGARMVALSGKDATNKWSQLELFMKRWRRIEALLDETGPFIYLASRSGMRRLDLSDEAWRRRARRRKATTRRATATEGPDAPLF